MDAAFNASLVYCKYWVTLRITLTICYSLGTHFYSIAYFFECMAEDLQLYD